MSVQIITLIIRSSVLVTTVGVAILVAMNQSVLRPSPYWTAIPVLAVVRDLCRSIVLGVTGYASPPMIPVTIRRLFVSRSVIPEPVIPYRCAARVWRAIRIVQVLV